MHVSCPSGTSMTQIVKLKYNAVVNPRVARKSAKKNYTDVRHQKVNNKAGNSIQCKRLWIKYWWNSVPGIFLIMINRSCYKNRIHWKDEVGKKNTFISTWAFSLTKVTEFIRIYSKLLNKDRNLIVGFILLFVSTRTDPFHKLFLRYLTSILISVFCKFPCRLWGLYFFIVTLSINSSSIKCLSI